MNYTESFRKFGATLRNKQWSVSAFNGQGEMITSCWTHMLKKSGDCLIYTDTFSRWSGNVAGKNELRRNIQTCLDEDRKVRIIFCRVVDPKDTKIVDNQGDCSGVKKTFTPRPDLIGDVVHLDKDRFIFHFYLEPV